MNHIDEVIRKTSIGGLYPKLKALGLYSELLTRTSFLDMVYENPVFIQRVWHIKNGMTIITCSDDLCDNPAKWTKNKRYGYCSKKCADKHRLLKYKETSLSRYGVESYSKTQDFLKKSRKTCEEKYGKSISSQADSVRKKISKASTISMATGIPQNKTRSKRLLRYKHKYLSMGYKLLDYHSDNNVLLQHIECNNRFTIKQSNISSRIKYGVEVCIICNPLGQHTSNKEKQLGEFIRTIYDKEIIYNSRSIIYPYELDIYLPDIGVAIEFNGDYWHANPKQFSPKDIIWNNTAENIWLRDSKCKERCESKGINLVVVWESDWDNNNLDVKESLFTLLKH